MIKLFDRRGFAGRDAGTPGPLVVEAVTSTAGPHEVADALAERPGLAFLDSALAHPRSARYSYVASDPVWVLEAGEDRVTLKTPEAVFAGRLSPFEALRETVGALPAAAAGAAAAPLGAGAIGFLGYDLKHFVERLPRRAARDVSIPDMWFGFYAAVAAYDHLEGTWSLAGRDWPGAPRARAQAFDRLAGGLSSRRSARADAGVSRPAEFASNFDRAGYERAVARTIDYIAAGDIFQANLSQRFTGPRNASAWTLYKRLRRANPAPYAAYIAGVDDSWAVLSSSPELFLKVRDGFVETRPIKGTRPRSGDAGRDWELARELMASAKDRAELTMIVDLERNDLGRVCRYGTVRVTEPRALESYETVHHLVATVTGVLHEGRDLVDLLKATFPGGSITGAPKVRAMEIIDELEPTARNLYTGSIGYVDLAGSADLNIAIRTVLVDGDLCHVQVGGGIVADSKPDLEYEETLYKAEGMFRALGTPRTGAAKPQPAGGIAT